MYRITIYRTIDTQRKIHPLERREIASVRPAAANIKQLCRPSRITASVIKQGVGKPVVSDAGSAADHQLVIKAARRPGEADLRSEIIPVRICQGIADF